MFFGDTVYYHVWLKVTIFPTILIVDPIGGTPSNINVIYASLKRILVGYNSFADNAGLSSFVQALLPLKSAKSREIPRIFELKSSSMSFKVIDIGINRKGICAFLLVINSNFDRISYVFSR